MSTSNLFRLSENNGNKNIEEDREKRNNRKLNIIIFFIGLFMLITIIFIWTNEFMDEWDADKNRTKKVKDHPNILRYLFNFVASGMSIAVWYMIGHGTYIQTYEKKETTDTVNY